MSDKITDILAALKYKPDDWFIKPRKPTVIGIKMYEAVHLLISKSPADIIAASKCSQSTFYRNINLKFPLKNKTDKWKTYLASVIEHKYCSGCNSLLPYSSFNIDNSTGSSFANKCRDCEKIRSKQSYLKFKEDNPAKAAKYRAAKLNATPKWTNLEKIQQFYKECPESYEVDHIVPLQGKNVCGLHVIDNLQYLTIAENRSKSNKWEYN